MGYAQRGMAQARQQRPCISSCMRGGGRSVTCMAGGRLSAAQQAKKEERPLRVPCSRAGGRGCAPRALPGVALTACHALGRAVARALDYLHGWREAVRRATGQKRRAALARRCRALPPCGDGLSGCDYPRETVGRRRETGPACGLRKLNQTGGRQVMGKTGQRAGAGGRWAEGERLAVAVLGRAGRERGARVKGGSSYFGLKGSGSGSMFI